jgi:O-glycosyl hydrolase
MRFLIPISLLAAALPLRADPATPAAYVIDLAETRQTIDHFGANDAWSLQKIGAWSEENKNRIADLLYTTDKGIGLTFCRFYVGGGINLKTIKDDWRTADTFEVSEGKYDWNRLANERWFLRAAKARGVRHFGMTIYSPPPRLTRNGLTNHGTDKTSSTNLKPGGEEWFARYMADILAHFRSHPDEAERIEFDRVFPINEPQWDWFTGQEGNRASNEDMRRIHLALQAELRKRQLRTLIAGPESGSIPGMIQLNEKAREKWRADYGDYLRFLAEDPQLARGLGGVMTYHSYWSDRMPGELVPHREALGKALAARPGWKLWQSEYCVMEGGRDLTIHTALRVARVIHCDLTLVNASSWQWWLAVANEDFKSGLIYTDYKKPGDPENILESKILWALGNYSRFIRPGMRRVEMSGGPQDVEGLMASAWLDRPNKRVVSVLVNMGETPRTVRLALAREGRISPAPLAVTPHTTSAGQNLSPGPPADAAKGVEIPARSVVTLVSL